MSEPKTYTTRGGHTITLDERALFMMRARAALKEEARYPTVGHVFRAEPVGITEEKRREIERRVRELTDAEFPQEKDT